MGIPVRPTPRADLGQSQNARIGREPVRQSSCGGVVLDRCGDVAPNGLAGTVRTRVVLRFDKRWASDPKDAPDVVLPRSRPSALRLGRSGSMRGAGHGLLRRRRSWLVADGLCEDERRDGSAAGLEQGGAHHSERPSRVDEVIDQQYRLPRRHAFDREGAPDVRELLV